MSHTFLHIDILLDLKLLLPDIRNLNGHLTKILRHGEQIIFGFLDERGEVYERGVFAELLFGDCSEVTWLYDFINR